MALMHYLYKVIQLSPEILMEYGIQNPDEEMLLYFNLRVHHIRQYLYDFSNTYAIVKAPGGCSFQRITFPTPKRVLEKLVPLSELTIEMQTYVQCMATAVVRSKNSVDSLSRDTIFGEQFVQGLEQPFDGFYYLHCYSLNHALGLVNDAVYYQHPITTKAMNAKAEEFVETHNKEIEKCVSTFDII